MKTLMSLMSALLITLCLTGVAFATDVVASSLFNMGWTQTGGSPAVDIRIECSNVAGGPYTGFVGAFPPTTVSARVDAVFGTALGQYFCTLIARNSAGTSARSSEVNVNYVSSIDTPPVGTATLSVTP